MNIDTTIINPEIINDPSNILTTLPDSA